MIEKINDIMLFLSHETNQFLTLIIFLSLIAAIGCCFLLVWESRYKQMALASILTAGVFFGVCCLGLVTKAYHEIGLRDYHLLVNTAQKHPILNKALVHFINRHNNKINGIDYAVIKNQLTQLERQHLKHIIQKDRKKA